MAATSSSHSSRHTSTPSPTTPEMGAAPANRTSSWAPRCHPAATPSSSSATTRSTRLELQLHREDAVALPLHVEPEPPEQRHRRQVRPGHVEPDRLLLLA